MCEDVTQVEYSEKEVIFLLEYYLEYRTNLISPTAVPEERPVRGEYKVEHKWRHELPLGHTHSDGPWPYMVKVNAPVRIDGKRRAMKAQDIHIAMVDLEHGLRCLTDNYLEVIYKYFLFQTHTLEELAVDLGMNSAPAVLYRRNSAIKALVRHMNTGARPVKV